MTAFVQVKQAKNEAGHGSPGWAENGLFKKSVHAVAAVSRLPASSSFSVGTGMPSCVAEVSGSVRAAATSAAFSERIVTVALA